MITFPDWSDLGLGYIQEATRMSWDYELMMCERHRYYFEGLVFDETVENLESIDDPPKMFPVGMNLVKMLTLAQADSVFGEWEENPIIFGTRQSQTPSKADEDAIDIASRILEGSNAGSMFWEHELDREVYGGGALKIVPDFRNPGLVKWTRVPRQYFFPIWDPDDPESLLEAYIVVPMTADQAKAKYGIENVNKDIIQRVEHWTLTEYTNKLDGQELRDFSGRNPWGIVPFVYTPRFRFHNWYGDALTTDVAPVQDQLNMLVADVGDAINYNSHPVRTGLNLPRDFNSENYPLGPNAFWNLGRALPGAPEPNVNILEVDHAVSPGVMEHISFIYDWSRTSVFAPPIAFGEDNGGGQRSGITLEIRMWPLIKSTRRSRSYLSTSIKKALKISAIILQQKQLPDVPALALRSLVKGNIVPLYHPIMPRDQAAIVDEVVKLGTMEPPRISLATSENILGRGAGEVDRIMEELNDPSLNPPEEEPVDQSSVPD